MTKGRVKSVCNLTLNCLDYRRQGYRGSVAYFSFKDEKGYRLSTVTVETL